MDIIKTKREIIDLANQKQIHLDAASAALDAKDHETYNSEMEKVRNISKEITDRRALVTEAEAAVIAKPEDPQEDKDKVSERVNALRKGDSIKLSTVEMLRGIRNSTLLTSPITQPVGAGTEIHDIPGSGVSALIDHVQTMDMTGMSSWEESYVIEELEAQDGHPEALSGTARAESDPIFGVAVIKPYELNVTHAVDKNIKRLTDTPYYEKVYSMAMKAMRRKLSALIVAGDGQVTPDMFGMLNGVNKAGAAIYATQTLSALDENTLDDLYYAYGADEECGEDCALILSKPRLKLLGKIRNSDKERVFSVKHKSKTIEDGGSSYPFFIARESAIGEKLILGDPLNYLLGLFGPMTVRIDESVYADRRKIAILGDAMVGGNIIAHHGFVVGSVAQG